MSTLPALSPEAFDYDLPAGLIADRPRRGESRLMVLAGVTAHTAEPDPQPLHHRFAELPSLLRRGDLLVYNDTRVLHARLHGRRILEEGGEETLGGRVEALLVEPDAHAPGVWRAMLKPGKRQRPGTRLCFSGLRALVEGRAGELFALRFEADDETVHRVMREHGELPLPPYLGRSADASDDADYQTVFARDPGAVAAPTAGLHFHQELLDRLDDAGVERAALTLHVGPGTFRPVQSERITDHPMDSERYSLPAGTVERIISARREGRRVIAVGTTTTRALEGAANAHPDGRLESHTSARTDLFIRPGHSFRVVDGLITNFHLPRSTLLMLVSALAGRRRVLAAYRTAVERRYRFYSYGDAMLLLP